MKGPRSGRPSDCILAWQLRWSVHGFNLYLLSKDRLSDRLPRWVANSLGMRARSEYQIIRQPQQVTGSSSVLRNLSTGVT